MTFGIFCIRALEILFFTGLAGCSLVVVISWVSILKSGLSDKDDMKMDEIPASTQQAAAYRFTHPDFVASPTFNHSVASANRPSRVR